MTKPKNKESLIMKDYKKFITIYNDIVTYPTIKSVGEAYGVSESPVRRKAVRVREGNSNSVLVDRSKTSFVGINQPIKTIKEKVREAELLTEITRLKTEVREAHKEILSTHQIKTLIYNGEKVVTDKEPSWLNTAKRKKSIVGIPFIFLSDIHFDEVVETAQIGFVNEYNHDVATKRIQHTFNTAVNLLKNYTVNPSYEGVVCALGGDMLSGNIHDELAETNEQSILRSVIDLTKVLAEGIETLANEFGNVFVPCVVGNHGRMHKKPRHKNKIFDNFEWMIYQNLAVYFSKDPRVTMYIPDGPDAIFSIYGKTFLLTHGDQFSGGSGIAGIFSPLMLGMARKQKKQAAIGRPFDVMLCGHFHQYIHTNSLIINGSIKGYDEYANNNNFSFERPQQALWIQHPEYDMIMRTPILCDAYIEEDSKKVYKEKVKVIF